MSKVISKLRIGLKLELTVRGLEVILPPLVQATEDFFMNITRDDEGGVFIGAEKKAGVWTWVDGYTWYGFGNWAPREPASDDVVVMIGYKNGNTLWYGLLKERGGVNYLCQY